MSHSLKAIVQFVIVVCCFVIGFSMLIEFLGRDPNHVATWTCFGVALFIAVACIGVLVRFRKPKHEAPDILDQITSAPFERDGFCFIPTIIPSDGPAVCRIWFQNNFTNACSALVAMEPACGLFDSGMFRWLQKGNPIKPFSLQIEAPAGAFGFADLPISLPSKCLGHPQKFFVGAHARYPEGRGPRVRAKAGVAVGKSTKNPGIGELAAAAGAIVISSPAKISVILPPNVKEEAPPEAEVSTVVLWTLDDGENMDLSIEGLMVRPNKALNRPWLVLSNLGGNQPHSHSSHYISSSSPAIFT